jgi:hypothetical protein
VRAVARVARLVVAEPAAVEQEQLRRAETHGAVRARVLQRGARHRLRPGAVAGGAAPGERDAAVRRRTALVPAGVVVLDLVVVPDRQQRVSEPHREQARIGLVERVRAAVVLERLRLAVGALSSVRTGGLRDAVSANERS